MAHAEIKSTTLALLALWSNQLRQSIELPKVKILQLFLNYVVLDIAEERIVGKMEFYFVSPSIVSELTTKPPACKKNLKRTYTFKRRIDMPRQINM